MKKHLLKVDSIIKYYGHRQLLSDIYLTCQTDQIIGILGRNGCGKSTLLKIIFGTEAVNHKYVSIDQQVLPNAFEKRSQIAYLPQYSCLPPWSSVRHIIKTFLPNRVAFHSVSNHKYIKPLMEQKAGSLSFGELRFLEIMLIMHVDAKFVMLDEPFLGIAPIYQEEIKQLLLKFKPKKGILVTDHNYRHILEISDYLLLIHNGHCKHIKSKEKLEYWGYLPNSPDTIA